MCYYNGEAQREFVVELTKPAPNPRRKNDACSTGEDHIMSATDITVPSRNTVAMRPFDGHASPSILGFGRAKSHQISLAARRPSLLHKVTSGLSKTYAQVYETVVPQPGPTTTVSAENVKNAENNASHSTTVTTAATSKGVSSGYDDCSFEHADGEEVRDDDDDMDLDDEDGFHKERVGELINSRYEVEELLGKGTFGKVLKCFDRVRREYVVIKMIRNTPAFFEAAQREIQMLKLMNQCDPEDKFNIVQMKDHFIFHSHQCIVFELLAESLYDLLRAGNFKGVSLNAIRTFARQILVSLEFMSRSDVNIMHCDLKPENILLRSSNSRAIKVIDFGSSCQETRQYYTYIQSRYYRAPEVMFRLPCYNKAIDMWSLGCLLMEMHTGQPIFDGRDILEQVHSMCSLLGIPPDYMLRRGTQSASYFVEIESEIDNDLHESRWEMVPWITRERGSKRRNLGDILGVFSNGPSGRWKNHPGHATIDYLVFKDLVEKMLVYDPAERITPSEALDHPFFSNSKHGRRPTVERPLSMECMAFLAGQKVGKSSASLERDDCSGVAVLKTKPLTQNGKGKPVSGTSLGQLCGGETMESWGDVDVDFTNAFDAVGYAPVVSKSSTMFPRKKQGSTFSSLFSGGQHSTVPCVF
eukprot:CAMPEP_0196652770 /NCGR_PEP_ID=MMETSP1086-20130531/2195_1 /TAXON_ID=77921 /ORGANISM="Cyanoptyche  gloeocystis , Strain SAG4.97" /LENGTH=640 /DNA_ID=CAMNT_0041983533 /DNA_START=105 /DNA_END=2027 /DNA_ORIENTATION=+